MILLLRLAGALHLVIAATNVFAAVLFRYRENMARVEPFVREVFWVQNAFIVLTTLFFGFLCLFLPHELTNSSPLAHALNIFLALFWGLRLIIQLKFYDPGAKHRFPLANRTFTLIFAFLMVLFATQVFRFV